MAPFVPSHTWAHALVSALVTAALLGAAVVSVREVGRHADSLHAAPGLVNRQATPLSSHAARLVLGCRRLARLTFGGCGCR